MLSPALSGCLCFLPSCSSTLIPSEVFFSASFPSTLLWLICPTSAANLARRFLFFFYQPYFRYEIYSWSLSNFLALKTLLNSVFYIELRSWETLDERSQHFVIFQIYKLKHLLTSFLPYLCILLWQTVVKYLDHKLPQAESRSSYLLFTWHWYCYHNSFSWW